MLCAVITRRRWGCRRRAGSTPRKNGSSAGGLPIPAAAEVVRAPVDQSCRDRGVPSGRGESRPPPRAGSATATTRRRRYSYSKMALGFGSGPAEDSKLTDARGTNLHTFGTKKGAFQLEIPTIAAQRTARRNHTVAGRGRISARPHDRPDGAPCPRTAGHFRNIAIRGYAARRNPPHGGEHPLAEIRVFELVHGRNRKRKG